MTEPRGFTVWLTGLSGSGKSTIARLAIEALERQGRRAEWLDGDAVRAALSPDLGFTRADRDLNVERLAWVASRLTCHGVAVFVSAISPYVEARSKARRLVEPCGPFLEVHVKASLEACAARDVKGLYRRAAVGEVGSFTGVSDPYEEPVRPDLTIDTERLTPEESARLLVATLEARSLTGGPPTA